MDASLLTVWGRSGAGKSTLAVNLACALAKTRCVGLISSNLQYGHLQSFFGQTIRDGKGILNALENPAHTKDYFWKAGMLNTFSNVFLLSVPNEYTGLQADTVTQEAVEGLLDHARAIFDVLIVDGCEDITNPVSSVALAAAKQILTVHRQSISSGMWYRSMGDFRRQLHLEDKLLHLIQEAPSGIHEYAAALHIQPRVTLPYIAEAQVLEDGGTPVCFDTRKRCRRYSRIMEQLIQDLWDREVII
jgi:MinD-like ATPase involved in chromosome partitioning or flagellar assembly